MACGLIWIGCSHSGFGARVAILRQVATTIPICARDQPAQSVANALARDWQPGDRMMVRGFLTAVGYGPPCSGHEAPGGAKHCTVVWTLSDSSSHPAEWEDAPPGGLLTLNTDRLPTLEEGDARAAQAAGVNFDVTVSGLLPESMCESPEGYPDLAERRTSVDCVDLSLRLSPLTITHLCRNPTGRPGAPVGAPADPPPRFDL